ncbi:hypothetical protein I6E75_13165 [Prevotella copri]|jgi:hypothetical protein|uniref:hypothetical protein n=1 Tax=Segatella copri TaxID=165179 RepID=UPI001F450F4B|nr:hypothetical protein [Segatella copri]MCF2611172.1 hypothetical protein [Segatella copri]
MNEGFNDIRKKMETKGYEYIQEIRAYCEVHTSSTGRIFGERSGFALFGKELGNITILRVCGTKYEYEITKANRVVYDDVGTVVFDNIARMIAEEDYEKVFCNAQFTSSNGTTWYFCNPYWN